MRPNQTSFKLEWRKFFAHGLTRASLALALVVAVVLLVSRARTTTVREARHEPALGGTQLCPLQTPEEWQQFLERSADNDKWVETCEDSTCDHNFYAQVEENVANVFDACIDYIEQHEAIARCTDHMRRFTLAWLRQHDDDSYGFTSKNPVYLQAEDGPDRPPGMMKIPDAIVAAIPNRIKVQEIARQNGWKYLTHDSALGGTRTFVYLPDPQGRFDLWMLLNLKDGNQVNANKSMPVSVIGVQKKTADGKTLPQIRLNFRDYTVEEIQHRTQLVVNESGNGKCYSCHASGMRQLIARWTPTLESKPVRGEAGFQVNDRQPIDRQFAFGRLVEFNKIIRAYGMPDWNGEIIPEDHGPALGRKMGCVDCHDGKVRGILTVSSSMAQINQKLTNELAMPPDTDLPRWLERSQMQNPPLNEDEKILLERAFDVHRGLTAEFADSRFPELKKWLLENPCR